MFTLAPLRQQFFESGLSLSTFLSVKSPKPNKIQGNNNLLLFIFCLFTVSLCFFLFQSGWPSLNAFTRITCCLFVVYHYIYPFLPLAGAVPIILSASVFLHLPSISRCSSHYFICICISPFVSFLLLFHLL